jgi:hypothetical protein
MKHLVATVCLLAAMSGCGGGAGPAVMEFAEVIPARPRIGDVVTVRFKLLDSRGLPLAGQQVDFKVLTGVENVGISLSPASAVSIKGSGFAETQVVASSRVNSMTIQAVAGLKVVQSPPISFAGTVANGRQFTFQCGAIAGEASGGVHAIGAYDSTRNLIAGVKQKCTAHTGDRNGDGVPNAIVSFLTEAGTIGTSETSKTDVIGNATVLHKTSYPLPLEVEPGTFSWSPLNDRTHTGAYIAPLWMHPFTWTADPRTPGAITNQEPQRPDPIRKTAGNVFYKNNPRDNLVSMIAVTAGEEGFSDDNNNGKQDGAEVFDDLPEPFVDSNDNGTYDADIGEKFIDVDGNGTWTPKNGIWDANALIWVQERLLWTGLPAFEDTAASPMNNPKPIFGAATPPIALTCPELTTVKPCPFAGGIGIRAYISDPWFNGIAMNGSSDGCKVATGPKSPVTARGFSLQGQKLTYPPGDNFGIYIEDARDPSAAGTNTATGMGNFVPKRVPAVGFVAFIECTATSAQESGAVVVLNAGSIVGTIE